MRAAKRFANQTVAELYAGCGDCPIGILPVDLHLLMGALLMILALNGLAQNQVELTLQRHANKVQLYWPSSIEDAKLGVVYPEFHLQRSTDLQHWTAVGGGIRAFSGRPASTLSVSLDTDAAAGFFRLAADLLPTATQQTGLGGEEVLGYAARLKEELNKVGWLSLDEFAAGVPPPQYLEKINWDPTSAAFWDLFNNPTNGLQLSSAELAVFMTNGFVVSERTAPWSFGGCYDNLYWRELPPFITADSILHAWHRSFAQMLADIEALQLSTVMATVLTNMHLALPAIYQEFGSGTLRESILDADYFLAVALSLWASKQVPSALPIDDQASRVATTLNDIAAQQFKEVDLFGSRRFVDFSQFKVRGYYVSSELLQRYFKAMMWCGRIDLRLVTFEPNKEDDIRQLGTTLVLNELVRRSGQLENWRTIDRTIQVFVGTTDSMTFAQWGQVLETENIRSLADVPDVDTLIRLRTRLLSGELGAQEYGSDHFFTPLSSAQCRLLRSFTVIGQKFILDGWAHAKVVFDRISWPTNDPPRIVDNKVVRRKTSALDVAYTVLANEHVVPVLVERMANPGGMAFRDGLPYQHQLKAVRNVVDSQALEVWTNSIYNGWLWALRALSEPTVGLEYPESMRTRAWAMRTLNTQLASWTELRHDTILYAKQPYSTGGGCGYPDGFVEPRPEFWQRMKQLAELSFSAISNLNASGTVGGVDLSHLRLNQLWFLGHFSGCMGTLAGIADKELAQLPLSDSESEFLQTIVDQNARAYGPLVPGWYPRLYYTAIGSVISPDAPLAADVFTDVPDPFVGDPGGVLHEATGAVNLLMIAVDNGPDRAVYAGPVSSYYEFYEPGVNRLSDQDWQLRPEQTPRPERPDWTQGWLVTHP